MVLQSLKIDFPLRKIFRGNLNKAFSASGITSFRFPRKISHKKKLTIILWGFCYNDTGKSV